MEYVSLSLLINLNRRRCIQHFFFNCFCFRELLSILSQSELQTLESALCSQAEPSFLASLEKEKASPLCVASVDADTSLVKSSKSHSGGNTHNVTRFVCLFAGMCDCWSASLPAYLPDSLLQAWAKDFVPIKAHLTVNPP